MEKILKETIGLLKKKDKASKGHCGYTIINLAKELKVSEKEIKPILNFLYKKNMLTIYKGVNNKHIKWKSIE